MEQLTLEGTWEEILLHTSELTGQRVRVTVLPNTEAPSLNKGASLDQVLKGRVGQVEFQPSDLSKRTGNAFADLLVAQHKAPSVSNDSL